MKTYYLTYSFSVTPVMFKIIRNVGMNKRIKEVWK